MTNLRTILVRSFQELDNGVTCAVPIDVLQDRSMRKNVSPEEINNELQAALQDGYFEITSPGMVGLTETGTLHYTQASAAF